MHTQATAAQSRTPTETAARIAHLQRVVDGIENQDSPWSADDVRTLREARAELAAHFAHKQ